MTEAMKRFLELNELMEREMQAQRQEANAAKNELVAQTYLMRKRINKDLLELDKLGVGEIETNIDINLPSVMNVYNHVYVCLKLNNDKHPAVLGYAYRFGFMGHDIYSVYALNDRCAPDVLLYLYEHWPEIMACAEERIMQKIVEKREAECARLELEIKTRDELLAKIKSAFEDE